MTLFDDIMPYFDEFIHFLWLKSENIVVLPKNLDAHKFNNHQF